MMERELVEGLRQALVDVRQALGDVGATNDAIRAEAAADRERSREYREEQVRSQEHEKTLAKALDTLSERVEVAISDVDKRLGTGLKDLQQQIGVAEPVRSIAVANRDQRLQWSAVLAAAIIGVGLLFNAPRCGEPPAPAEVHDHAPDRAPEDPHPTNP